MAKNVPQEYTVPVERLQIGVFVRLDIPWYKHPFLLNAFKIKSTEQIRAMQQAGIEHVVVVPEKSDKPPLSEKPGGRRKRPPEKATGTSPLFDAKREHIERLRARRAAIRRTEHSYRESIGKVGEIMRALTSGAVREVGQAEAFVDTMVESFLSDAEATLHLMNLSQEDEGLYYHSLNVAVLCMLLGREMHLDREKLRVLGLGALLHDIGKACLDKKLVRKRGPLSTSEKKLMRRHPALGVKMLSKEGEIDPQVMKIVYQHHERADGKGYPRGLRLPEIVPPARYVQVANTYDNFVNRPDAAASLTPYQALAVMYSRLKSRFDPEILAVFIRMMGIYPPGTVVRLSSGEVGLVISVNPNQPLYPHIMLYDANVPADEAVILDLATETELKVTESIKPSELPREIFDYLSPRTRISYYVDPKGPGQAAT